MYLFGASGHAKVIMATLAANGIEVKGFFDDDPGKKSLNSIPVVGHTDDFHPKNTPCLISIGDNHIRKRVVERIKTEKYANAIHPRSILSSPVGLGVGTAIMAGVVINADVRIGNHVIINTSASVDHDCDLGDYCHIAPNSTLCGGISVGEGAFIGAGAVVVPNTRIGKWSVVGAGAVVLEDVPDGATVVGNPARVVKTGNTYD